MLAFSLNESDGCWHMGREFSLRTTGAGSTTGVTNHSDASNYPHPPQAGQFNTLELEPAPVATDLVHAGGQIAQGQLAIHTDSEAADHTQQHLASQTQFEPPGCSQGPDCEDCRREVSTSISVQTRSVTLETLQNEDAMTTQTCCGSCQYCASPPPASTGNMTQPCHFEYDSAFCAQPGGFPYPGVNSTQTNSEPSNFYGHTTTESHQAPPNRFQQYPHDQLNDALRPTNVHASHDGVRLHRPYVHTHAEQNVAPTFNQQYGSDRVQSQLVNVLPMSNASDNSMQTRSNVWNPSPWPTDIRNETRNTSFATSTSHASFGHQSTGFQGQNIVTTAQPSVGFPMGSHLTAAISNANFLAPTTNNLSSNLPAGSPSLTQLEQGLWKLLYAMLEQEPGAVHPSQFPLHFKTMLDMAIEKSAARLKMIREVKEYINTILDKVRTPEDMVEEYLLSIQQVMHRVAEEGSGAPRMFSRRQQDVPSGSQTHVYGLQQHQVLPHAAQALAGPSYQHRTDTDNRFNPIANTWGENSTTGHSVSDQMLYVGACTQEQLRGVFDPRNE